MNLKEWAEKLNGREIGDEVTSAEAKQMADEGVIVAFGASDDLLEFRGALYEECGAYEGTEGNIFKNKDGEIKLINERFFNELDDLDDNLHDLIIDLVEKQIESMPIIKATWCPKELKTSWLIETSIPHETFDIYEDGELYCRGIVFHADNVPTV